MMIAENWMCDPVWVWVSHHGTMRVVAERVVRGVWPQEPVFKWRLVERSRVRSLGPARAPAQPAQPVGKKKAREEIWILASTRKLWGPFKTTIVWVFNWTVIVTLRSHCVWKVLSWHLNRRGLFIYSRENRWLPNSGVWGGSEIATVGDVRLYIQSWEPGAACSHGPGLSRQLRASQCHNVRCHTMSQCCLGVIWVICYLRHCQISHISADINY